MFVWEIQQPIRLRSFLGDIDMPFFAGMMEGGNRGMLGQKPGTDSMFIKNGPHGAEPIIPTFQHSNIPIVSRANQFLFLHFLGVLFKGFGTPRELRTFLFSARLKIFSYRSKVLAWSVHCFQRPCFRPWPFFSRGYL